MQELPNEDTEIKKRDDILSAAKKLFLEQGYHATTVRQIVQEANTSMGNLYFHFPNKLSILKVISKEFITILRNQIEKVHNYRFSPELGFALDFRMGYVNTLENPKLSQLWCIIQNTPEVHKYSLENKKKRLRTFFGDLIPAEELDLLAIAIQGISDSIFQQKREGQLIENPIMLSNMIIDYSLRLLGYPRDKIKRTIIKVDKIIKKEHDMLKEYYNF